MPFIYFSCSSPTHFTLIFITLLYIFKRFLPVLLTLISSLSYHWLQFNLCLLFVFFHFSSPPRPLHPLPPCSSANFPYLIPSPTVPRLLYHIQDLMRRTWEMTCCFPMWRSSGGSLTCGVTCSPIYSTTNLCWPSRCCSTRNLPWWVRGGRRSGHSFEWALWSKPPLLYRAFLFQTALLGKLLMLFWSCNLKDISPGWFGNNSGLILQQTLVCFTGVCVYSAAKTNWSCSY